MQGLAVVDTYCAEAPSTDDNVTSTRSVSYDNDIFGFLTVAVTRHYFPSFVSCTEFVQDQLVLFSVQDFTSQFKDLR